MGCIRLWAQLCTPVVLLVLSDSPTLIFAPFVRTSFGARSFCNSLPPSLRTCTSLDGGVGRYRTFHRHFMAHYCQQAFQST